MFLRFRTSATGRLQVVLVEARRVNGAVRQQHVAGLGSISPPGERYPWVAVWKRRDIWQQLHEHIARLALDGAKAGKLMLALQARVPLPTVEEIGAAELAEAEHDAAFWERMHGSSATQIESYQRLIAATERAMANERENMKREAENAETAKAKAARLANYRGA